MGSSLDPTRAAAMDVYFFLFRGSPLHSTEDSTPGPRSNSYIDFWKIKKFKPFGAELFTFFINLYNCFEYKFIKIESLFLRHRARF